MPGKRRYPCTIMRGGTSKGIFLLEKDLPADPALRERLILAIFGSPDPRQIDGLGGADSLTSKLAIIAPAQGPGRDVDYTYAAVGIDRPFVDYSANCGNLSSAVGPYAIDRGLVEPVEPFTTVRIYNTNTRKLIRATVPVRRGRVVADGDYAIDGCPGSGARIDLAFVDPGGAVTGRLLPTGNVVDTIELAAGGRYPVTVVDAANPTAFVPAAALGLAGDELPGQLEAKGGVLERLEAIRREVGRRAGIAVSPSLPKIAFVAPARDCRTLSGRPIAAGEVHLLARVISIGRMHKAFAITAAIPAAIAAILPGSVVNGAAAFPGAAPATRTVVIGHPSGVVDLQVEAGPDRGLPRIVSCTVGRTARKIMDGWVHVPGRLRDSGAGG